MAYEDSDALIGLWAGGEDSDQDEKLLIDFHLGNAINLDIVDAVVTGKLPDYELMIPKYYITDYSKLKSITPRPLKIEIGFLKCTSELLSLPSDPCLFSPQQYKQIVSIIAQGFLQRDVKMPLTVHAKEFESQVITVRSNYDRIFKRTLRAIGMLSERLRGGYKSVYADVNLTQSHASVRLTEGDIISDLYVGRNISAIYTHHDKTLHVGNYDSVLLLLDTVGQRICLDVGCQVTSISKTPGTIPRDILDVIIMVGDQILKTAGNKGYEVIGLFEPSVVSILLINHPDSINNPSTFYENCMGELDEICNNEVWGGSVKSLWENMMELLKICNPEILSNLFSIYRIWGHPRVDIRAGMQKVYDKGTAKKISMNTTPKLVLCQFRRMFLNAYLSKKRQYPPLSIPDGDKYVWNRLRKNLPIDRYSPGFSIWDYEEVSIGQIWSLPETYDVCHILNDKAVSPNRSELHNSIRSGHGTMAGAIRRGIIRWMMGESIRCKQFLNKVNTEGLDEDSLIIGMYEKEREIKVKARMFSLMSEEMRMYFVLTEELIANHILPYFPEITMKDPLHVQLRKIWAAGGKGQHPLNPNINIDFEKWNLNMRHEFTAELFCQMDQMFGYENVISRTHEIFYESYIYSSSGKYVPPITPTELLTDPPMAYRHHLGGFEGLRQKGWTVATVCLLAYIAESMNLEMCLLGQGDNQVLKLYMPIPKWNNLCYTEASQIREAKELTCSFVEKMNISFADAGLPIKVRETWISCRLFMYGKTMYLDGKNLPQWSKKLLRSYAMSNEGSLTVSGVVGTIATNMSAAAGVSTMPDIMYILYLIMAEWSTEYLLGYHPFTRKTIRQGDKIPFRIPGYKSNKILKSSCMVYKRLIATILTVPTSVGGSVNIPLTSYITRGFPDHAAEGYAWIKLLASVPSDLQSLYLNWYSFMANETVQADMLIQSPWSLNHLKPPTPGLQSRDIVREWILSGRFYNNIFLNNVKEIEAYFDRKGVCKELFTNPMNPLVTYEIYQGFPHCYYDSVLRRFEGTRSVKKLAMQENNRRPIVKKLMEIEHHYLGYLIWRSETTGESYSECATEHVRTARNLSWGTKITGVTTPHPLEFLFDKTCLGYDTSCPGTDYIHLRFDTKGDSPPYLGSKVKTKVVSQQDEGARIEPLICTNARVARYINWLGVGKNMRDIVEMSSRAVCDIDVFDSFFDEDPFGEMFSGSVEHRFNPAAASEGCFINYSPQIGSTVMMSSDHMPIFGKGKANYTLHFQAMYCFLQYIGANLPMSSSKHYHLHCNKCIVPVEDEIGDVNENHPHIDRAFHPDVLPVLRRTLGEITVKVVPEVQMERINFPGKYIQIDQSLHFRNKAYYGTILLLATKCAYAIFTRGYKQSEGLGADDLQSFPRVYSYKLYVDHIVWTTVRVLFYLQCVYMNEIPSIHIVIRIRERLRKVIMHSPLNKFKELASLCLGRMISKDVWIEQSQMIQGSFPETTTSFLRTVKQMLIAQLDEFALGQNQFPKYVAVPTLSCSFKEHQTICGFLASEYRCWDCMSIAIRTESNDYSDCRFKHLSKVIYGVQLVNTSLDRLVKSISVKRRKEKPKALEVKSILLNYQVLTMRHIHNVEMNLYEYENLKRQRRIHLPTSSAYKWSDVLAHIDLEPEVVVVLGDGTGATSAVSASKFPNATIFPCAFIEGKRGIPQDLDSLRPGLSRSLSNVKGEFQESIPDDVTDESWKKFFLEGINRMNNVLIISDLEDEGGNIELTRTLLKCTGNSHVIIKLYGSEIPKISDTLFPFDNATLLLSPQGNIQYGEFFLFGKSTAQMYQLNIPYILKEGLDALRNDVNTRDKIREQNLQIEKVFMNMVRLSERLAQEHLTSKGLIISKKLWSEDIECLLALLFSFINSRYRFPQDKIRSRDVRNLSDGSLGKIVSGIKIVLFAIFGESILEKTWFQRLFLARCDKKKRISGISNLKIILVSDRLNSPRFSKKDLAAGRILSQRMGQSVVCPDNLVDLYAMYIAPAMSSNNLNVLRLKIALNETVETLSDLSDNNLNEEDIY